MTAPRLRQLVIAAETLETADRLGELLGLGAPFIDPGVKEFGLENRVYAIGDQFLEVVVPMTDSAPARRFIDRGDGGRRRRRQGGGRGGGRRGATHDEKREEEELAAAAAAAVEGKAADARWWWWRRW